MSEEYSEEYSEKYSKMMEDSYEFFFELNSWDSALTHSIWRGQGCQAILQLLLQSHLPHSQPVYSSNFSPSTRLSRSPTYSPDWVTLHDFSSKSVVTVVRTLTNCQLEVTNVLESGTTSSSKYYIKKKMYLKVYNHSGHCVYPSAKCDVGNTTEWLEYSWIPLR